MGKRKLSAYNRHVAAELKAGRTMKQAAASWRGGGKTSKPRSSGGRRMAKRKSKGGRRGSRILGNIGIKGLVTGGALLAGTQLLLPNIGGEYSDGVKLIAAGAAAKALKVGGASLMAPGAMMVAAKFIGQMLSGRGLSFASGGVSGGYDY